MNLDTTIAFDAARAKAARDFVARFARADGRPKFVFGCNVYGRSLVDHLPIEGFIDDFRREQEFLGRPVMRLEAVPSDALVLVASGGRPLTALKRVSEAGFDCLDYFSFLRWSDLPLREVAFNEGFADDYRANAAKYETIYNRLADEESRATYRKLINFRLSYDLSWLAGFSAREDMQYFEDFLRLREEGETFLDVGAYDGFTAESFIARCPGYKAVHIFEPEPQNLAKCRARLAGRRDIHMHAVGLSDRRQTLQFEPAGSSSRIASSGGIEIAVDRLDDVIDADPTLIKMDIEGGELSALEGARDSIARSHPRLAISIYHNAGDFWRLPKAVLDVRPDYSIFVRHYTESIYETVMFFQPAWSR